MIQTASPSSAPSKISTSYGYMVSSKLTNTKSGLDMFFRSKMNMALSDPRLTPDERTEITQDFGNLQKMTDALFLPFEGLAEQFALVMKKWKK